MKNMRFLVLASLVLVATFLRLAPLPANFSPIAAIALFAGAILAQPRWLALVIPLISLAISDLLLGYVAQPFVYASYALIALLGYGLVKQNSEETPVWSSIGLSALAASAVFFLVSNFGVWVEGNLYSRTGEGLVACYLAAVPFFWNTMVGDLVFTFGIFATWAVLVKSAPSLRVVRGR